MSFGLGERTPLLCPARWALAEMVGSWLALPLECVGHSYGLLNGSCERGTFFLFSEAPGYSTLISHSEWRLVLCTVETPGRIYVGGMHLLRLEVQWLTETFRVKMCPRGCLTTWHRGFRFDSSESSCLSVPGSRQRCTHAFDVWNDDLRLQRVRERSHCKHSVQGLQRSLPDFCLVYHFPLAILHGQGGQHLKTRCCLSASNFRERRMQNMLEN